MNTNSLVIVIIAIAMAIAVALNLTFPDETKFGATMQGRLNELKQDLARKIR